MLDSIPLNFSFILQDKSLLFQLGWKVNNYLLERDKRAKGGEGMVKVLLRIRIQESEHHETSQQEVKRWHVQKCGITIRRLFM